MYCFPVGHRLPTLKHTGRFIRELDGSVRWQVAWQGGIQKKRKETGGILCFHLHTGVFFASKHISLARVHCWEVNQLETLRYFLMKMLSPRRYIPDALIILLGQIIHPDILITLAWTGLRFTYLWILIARFDKDINKLHIIITCLVTPVWQYIST